MEDEFATTRDGWTFDRRLEDLPADMRSVLRHAAGERRRRAGEDFNTGDIIDYPSNAQPRRRPCTRIFGSILWNAAEFSGLTARGVLYDRARRDACVYSFSQVPITFRLGEIRAPIQRSRSHGDSGHCDYQSAETFTDVPR